MTTHLNFGDIRTVFLFGGGKCLRYVAKKLKKDGFRVFVFTSKRLINQQHEGISLAKYLKENNIKFEITDNINNNSSVKKLITKDSLGISFGSPWIFNEEFIKLFNNKLLNSHPRNLPRNRGGGGPTWLILNDEKQSANVLHLIDMRIDGGDIVKKEEFAYPKSCKTPIDYDLYSLNEEKTFFDSFFKDIVEKKTFILIPQDEDKSTYFPRLHSLTQGFINWDWNKDEIIKFINAFDDPYCGASTYLDDERVFLKKSSLLEEKETFHPFLAGLIYRKNNKGIFVSTKTGCILISEVKDKDNKSIIEKIRVGKRFFTPISDLEYAKKFYPIYTPNGLKND